MNTQPVSTVQATNLQRGQKIAQGTVMRVATQYVNCEPGTPGAKNSNMGLVVRAVYIIFDKGNGMADRTPNMDPTTLVEVLGGKIRPLGDCQRCGGTGQYGSYGECFDCGGRGTKDASSQEGAK